MTTATSKIPEISDDLLAERMKQIRYVETAMVGTDGKPHKTEEKDARLFDLFFVETNVHPRDQSFNFAEDKKFVEKARSLRPLGSYDILVKIGGYHGFCKASFAEVMSQIPETIVNKAVAFSLDPSAYPKILDEDYQSLAIIFYEQGEGGTAEVLPAFDGLIKPIDLPRAERLKDRVRPVIPWTNGAAFVDPGNLLKPFMRVGIWLRINGCNIHENNAETKITGSHEFGDKVSVYQEFTDGADFFKQSYAYLISQIPDELLTDDVIGLSYNNTDYFKTDKGVIHKSTYSLVKKV